MSDTLLKEEPFETPADKQVESDVLLSETRAVAIALLEWVDAVPSDTKLPAMPGIDRDWIDSVLFG